MRKDELTRIAKKQVDSFDVENLKNSGFIPRNGLYFPTIYYPPIPMYPKSDEKEMVSGLKYNNSEPLIYIHIPFCLTRCSYCHWVVSVGNSSKEIEEYLENLEKEMDLWKEKLGVGEIFPKSVLIGGGTPSLLSPTQIERLLKSFRFRFNIEKCVQFIFEAEPKTLLGDKGMEKLKIIKDYGVNRISLGVQSFDDEKLKEMGRAHTADDAIRAIKQIREAGFESLCIDLIYGYPGDTPKKWMETLKIALLLDIDGYQLYRLRIVPHGDKAGIIKNEFDRSPEIFPDLKEVYLMKELGILATSQKEFKEVSRRIFAKSPKHGSYYNYYYCALYDVIGFGVSSWSNLGDRIFINTGNSLKEYYSYIRKGKLPITRGKIRTEDDRKRWALALPLKSQGVLKELYNKIAGITVNEAFPKKIERLKKIGLLEENDKILKLTKKGAFFADEVIIQFYHTDYLPFPKTLYADGELNPYNVQ